MRPTECRWSVVQNVVDVIVQNTTAAEAVTVTRTDVHLRERLLQNIWGLVVTGDTRHVEVSGGFMHRGCQHPTVRSGWTEGPSQ